VSAFELNTEQAAAATSLRGAVLVTAGAGSGKTRVLTERTANAVIPGAVAGWDPIGIDQVLEITFTDKAAGELAERVRGTLRAAGLHEQSRQVGAAWISTIHGMCARILRTEALEAGIDPSFRMLDTVTTGRLTEEAFEDVARASIDAAVSVNIFEHWDYSAVASAVMRLSEELRTQGRSASDLRVADTEGIKVPAAEAIRFFKDKVCRFETCGIQGDAAVLQADACERTASALAEMVESGLDDGDLAEALWHRLTEHEIGRRGQGIKALKEDVDDIEVARTELCSRIAGVITAPYARILIDLTVEYANRYAELKKGENGLDFTDLQTETLRILRIPAVASRWRDRFKLTMVDEFQDTDILQLEIAKALAGQNLCTVGDENQSIYRFRGADVDVFRRHREEMAQKGAVTAVLNKNYRSHPEVLTFVNRVFGAPQFFGDEVVPLEPGREEPNPPFIETDQPRVEIVVAQLDQKAGVGADMARRSLAKEIASRIDDLTSRQGVPLGEVVILMSAYTHAHVYAKALADRGIETSVVGGSRFFQQPEISALRAALRTVSNNSDEVGASGFLASALCDLSDDGMLSLRRYASENGCGTWPAVSATALDDDDARRARAAVRAVEHATAAMGMLPLGEIVLRLIEDCGFDLRMLGAGTEGSRAYANVLKLSRMASEYEASGGSGVAGFLGYLDDKERYREHEAPASLAADEQDAVRIMSIHASKGLEFPVVFVPGLESSGRADTEIARWGRRADHPALSLALPASWGSNREYRCPPTFTELEQNESESAQQERKRLLYVACTRAREKLVLAGARTFKESTSSTMLNWLVEALELPLGQDVDRVIEFDGGARASFCTINPEVGTLIEDEPERPTPNSWWLDTPMNDPAPKTTLAAPSRLSYSAISLYRGCPLRFYSERMLGLGVVRGDSSSPALRFGSALHVMLQSAGETGAPGEEAVARIARYHGLNDDGLKRARDAIQNYQESQLAERVREAASVQRELEFSVWIGRPGEGFVLDGTMDAYARTGDSALIVDYKTGVRDENEEALAARFELQARCYALAAAVDGARSIEAVFVRPEVVIGSAPQTVSFSFTDDQARSLAPELELMHQNMKSGSWPHKERWAEDLCGSCPVVPGMCPIKAAENARVQPSER
jgi:ATP-dependent exoDNAse (exonuclease V) beta subunit